LFRTLFISSSSSVQTSIRSSGSHELAGQVDAGALAEAVEGLVAVGDRPVLLEGVAGAVAWGRA
jgi:hypothetical protein